MALTREQVIAAFWEAAEMEFAHIPPEDEIDYTFSEEFCRKREELIKEEAKGSFRLMPRRKRRAILLVAALLAMVLLVGCSERLQQAMANMFIEIYETFTRSRPEDTLRDEIETVYEFGWVPEGYELVSQNRFDTKQVKTSYQNKAGNEFVLRQYAGNDALTSADKEQGVEMTIGGKETIIYIGNGVNRATWIYDGYYFTISYSTEIGLDEVEKLVRALNPAA